MKLKILAFIAVMAVTGCDNVDVGINGRYTVDKDNKGSLFVLDTRTGKVSIVQDGQLWVVPSEESIGIAKNFPTQKIPGYPIEITDLEIKFRNGRLLYRGAVKYKEASELLTKTEDEEDAKPIDSSKALEEQKTIVGKIWKLWEGSSNRVLIILNDLDRFKVASFEIKRKGMYSTVDHQGNPEYVSFEGETIISPKDYEEIVNFSMNWRLPAWKADE